jgi:formimidoylglutamate deiminase
VHGIHVEPADVRRLAESGAIVVSCPTTEGSLGDGHFPALTYRDAGVRIAIGSDSQVRIDPFEEARELETLARRERRTRHALLASYGDLWGELVGNGLASLGLDDEHKEGQSPFKFAASGTIAIDRDHPDLRGIADEDLPAAVATCASASVVCRPV